MSEVSKANDIQLGGFTSGRVNALTFARVLIAEATKQCAWVLVRRCDFDSNVGVRRLRESNFSRMLTRVHQRLRAM